MSSSTSKKSADSKPKAAIKKVPSSTEMASTKVERADASSKVLGPELRKQELIEKVVNLSGAKKKDAKPVIEAMLDVLGQALAEGREFNLQPLGKLKLNRTKETAGARIIVAKIRQSKGANETAKDGIAPVAAAAE